MTRFSIIIFALLVLNGIVSAGDDIYEYIHKGELEKASELLSASSTASIRDGNRLFFQALIEPNAERVLQLLQAATRADLDMEYQEEAQRRLADIYFTGGHFTKLTKLIANYQATFENGRYDADLRRYSMAVDQLKGRYKSAVRQADRYLLRYTKAERNQWGQIDKARIMDADKKRVAADLILRKLARKRSGSAVPVALYMQAMRSIRLGRVDDAVFYYNLLREGYPGAIGLDAIVEAMGGITTSDRSENEAENLTGTFYSVQVGVFSQRSNARKQAQKFESYDKPVDIRSKTVSNKKYRVVYVGRFSTFDDASNFKKRLEAEHHEVFQVVAR